MRVYNLTNKEVFFRKQSIPPAGGFRDYPELDYGVPEIDRPLMDSKVLAFGRLPSWWNKKPTSPPKKNDVPSTDESHEELPEISDPSVIQEVPLESRLSKKELRNMRRGKK